MRRAHRLSISRGLRALSGRGNSTGAAHFLLQLHRLPVDKMLREGRDSHDLLSRIICRLSPPGGERRTESLNREDRSGHGHRQGGFSCGVRRRKHTIG
ncbi:hypothetical protein LSAT2_024101 [Lamellibrachia satsuma]|nr:hypothetical protein LSAT2_024101 [Lamellibrachia satsuma]